MKLVREEHVCVQGGGSFQAYVLAFNGERFFATEDFNYLLASLEALRCEDSTVKLCWDRNSAELPELGPEMDVQIYSPLYLRRVGDNLQFENDSERGRASLYSVTFHDWVKVVERFNRKERE